MDEEWTVKYSRCLFQLELDDGQGIFFIFLIHRLLVKYPKQQNIRTKEHTMQLDEILNIYKSWLITDQ